MRVCMEKGGNTVMNSGIFTFLPQNLEASVNPEVKQAFIHIIIFAWPFFCLQLVKTIMPSTFSPLASVLSRWENQTCTIPICNCVACDHHTATVWFARCRWLSWRSRPTETASCPKRPSSMQATLWKTLSWEWVSKIPRVLHTQRHNKDDCSTLLLLPTRIVFLHVTDQIQNNVMLLYWPPCRSSPSPVYAMKPSSVQPLTTFCSTECCSRSTPSNSSPPTASSTTSVSFSPPPDEHSAAIAPLSVPALFLTGTKHNVDVYGNIFRGI